MRNSETEGRSKGQLLPNVDDRTRLRAELGRAQQPWHRDRAWEMGRALKNLRSRASRFRVDDDDLKAQLFHIPKWQR